MATLKTIRFFSRPLWTVKIYLIDLNGQWGYRKDFLPQRRSMMSCLIYGTQCNRAIVAIIQYRITPRRVWCKNGNLCVSVIITLLHPNLLLPSYSKILRTLLGHHLTLYFLCPCRIQDVSASVSVRRRDGQGQSHVGFLRRPEGKLRRATSLAVPSEGDVDVAESEPARTRCRRLPPRPDKFIVQKTDHGDEHRQRMSAVRVAGCPRRVLERLRQGRSDFSQGHCRLFRSILNAFRWTRRSGEKSFCWNAVLGYFIVPLFLLYVHVVRGGRSIRVTGWADGTSRQGRVNTRACVIVRSIPPPTDINNITVRGDSGSRRNTNTSIVTFNLPPVPKYLKIGFIRVSVSVYIPNPLRCFNCQNFGHGSRTCKGATTCATCGQVGHGATECHNNPKCVNCAGAHSASSKECPKWVLEKKVQAVKAERGISFIEARKIVTSENKAQPISRGQSMAVVVRSSGGQQRNYNMCNIQLLV